MDLSTGEGDDEAKVKFMEENKGQFNEIQHFLMIVKDWAEEFVSNYDEASPKKRPQVQGIRGFYDSQQVEIQSPFRKKKKGGLVKLELNSLSAEKRNETKD